MKQIIGYSMAHVPIPLLGFCKLILNDGTVVELRGKGTLRWDDIALYKTLATEIEVGKKCTSIEGGFYSFTELIKLTIPSSVTSITLSLAPSITAGCSKLKEIIFDAPLPLPSGIAGSYGVSNVNKIIIGPHVTGINGSACTGSHITSITIPSNVKYIGEGAFSYCNELTLVNILNGCTTINDNAFYNCSNLTSVNIPDSVTSIGGSAFYGTPFINNMADGVIYLGKCLYKYKGTMPSNTEIVIEDGTTSISNNVFAYCNSLTSVTIPNSVKTIGNGAFYCCRSLTFVNIPNSVISIGAGAFSSCSGLISVTIGSGVTIIDKDAFVSCSGLTSIVSLTTTAPTIQNDTFLAIGSNGTLYVPSGSSGYDAWMETGDYYLGKYGWTKVEQ